MPGKYKVRYCKTCNDNVKSNWIRHLSSKKHKLKAGYITKNEAKKDTKAQNFFVTFQRHVKYLVAKKFEGPKWSRWFKRYIQAFIVCNNCESGSTITRYSHMVIKYKEPVRFELVQYHLQTIIGFRADDIKSCKNVRNSVIFCSKEDCKCVMVGFDWSWISPVTSAFLLAKKNKYRQLNESYYPYSLYSRRMKKAFELLYTKYREDEKEEYMYRTRELAERLMRKKINTDSLWKSLMAKSMKQTLARVIRRTEYFSRKKNETLAKKLTFCAEVKKKVYT